MDLNLQLVLEVVEFIVTGIHQHDVTLIIRISQFHNENTNAKPFNTFQLTSTSTPTKILSVQGPFVPISTPEFSTTQFRKLINGRFSRSQKICYYGTKLILYSSLILLFSWSSAEVTKDNATFNSNISEKNDPLEKFTSPTIRQTEANTTIFATIGTTQPSEKCVKAAIEQFPRSIIGPTARKYGAIIIHILICVYSFFGLAIICDNYFVTSLDRICEELKLSADVAGATFMAAGSSAPELATVIIGVFLAQDDIGISGVIGSAVFNILFVIAICGLFATSALYLSWWPLCRDCFFYTLSILIMLIAIANEVVNCFESILLLVTYVIYCVSLYYNEQLEVWVSKFPPFNTLSLPTAPTKEPIEDPYTHLEDHKTPGYSTTEDTYPNKRNSIEDGGPRASNGAIAADHVTYYKPKEPRPSEVNPLEMPVTSDKFELYRWYVVYPIHFLSQATMPDCKTDKYRNWYPATFVISMIWISFYSYIMVWMITIIGHTFGIPDTVMGLTFVAAGVSVPDALSSLAVVKEGYGDMAVSNAVGSNVFDILVCLGLPWFLKTGIISPGTEIKVYSKGLTYSTVSLLSTVVMLIMATHWNGWKLDKKFGLILMIGYFVFIIVASLYELNVFGKMNPDVCPSSY